MCHKLARQRVLVWLRTSTTYGKGSSFLHDPSVRLSVVSPTNELGSWCGNLSHMCSHFLILQVSSFLESGFLIIDSYVVQITISGISNALGSYS